MTRRNRISVLLGIPALAVLGSAAALASLVGIALAAPPEAGAGAGGKEAKVDFAKEVQPILKESCVRCHGAPDAQDKKKKAGNGLRLDDRVAAFKGGKSGKAIVPGKAEESLLYKVLLGPVKGKGKEIPAMPKGKKGESSALPAEKIEVIKKWIDQGAVWSEGGAVSFAKDIQPIFADACVRCHGAPDPKDPRKRPANNLRLDELASLMKGGKSGKAVLPGKGSDSLLYKVLLGPAKVGGREVPAMPKAMGGPAHPLEQEKIDLVKKWIDGGAK